MFITTSLRHGPTIWQCILHEYMFLQRQLSTLDGCTEPEANMLWARTKIRHDTLRENLVDAGILEAKMSRGKRPQAVVLFVLTPAAVEAGLELA